jgi:hypothetical protein
MHRTAIGFALLACCLLALAGCNHETSDWKAATAANTTDAYQQFINQYPKSANVPVAQQRIAQQQEAHDWQTATTADTRESYQQYLTQHADGPNAQEARIRLENFAQAASPAVASANTAAAAAGVAKAGRPPKPALPASTVQSTPTTAAGGPVQEAVAAAMSQSAVADTNTGAHYVQLGAFRSRAGAENHWKHLTSRFSHELGSLTPRYVAGKSHAASVVRLRVAVSSRAQGKALCEKLRAHAQSCVQVSAG